MVRKVFWEEPYRTQLATHVAAVRADEVSLRESIFYARSGGQESDAGTIDGHEVLEARKDGFELWYRLAPGHGLAPADPVDVAIDWQRRYRLMRLHFAAEIVLEIVYALRPGTAKTGAHIGAERARIDFEMAQNVALLFAEIEARAGALIAADRPIVSAYSDAAAERRYWEIAGFARVPCGGTHLRRTGEIGSIVLKRRNLGRGLERIEISLASPQ